MSRAIKLRERNRYRITPNNLKTCKQQQTETLELSDFGSYFTTIPNLSIYAIVC